MATPVLILAIIAAVVALPFLIYGLVIFMSMGFKLVGTVLGNIGRFVTSTVSDMLRLVGAVIAAAIFIPLIVLSIVVGRWSRSKHYSSAFASECSAVVSSLYRLFVGNPARLLGLSAALEGLERRVPDAMAAAPTRDTPSKKRVGMFDGYEIVGSLKGGGSGGKLYIAEPNELKRAAFDKRGLDIDQVVIKVFSLGDGSSLPQIVRESRALEAARNLGLVIEHEMTKDRFFYVMRYVPGDPLSAVTQRLHARAPSEGLGERGLRDAMRYTRDLLVALHTYHQAGLWHKDVKPDNIIVDPSRADATAHLVDFGLITPLRSAMTLTTHGTEYFRDPELVRQALRGVKVHQIDGTRFDVYAAGAVLYSILENSFPAHAGLSQISKRCPDALRWIVRRAMTDYDKRYANAHEMLADLEVVLGAEDPFAVKPAALPSVSGENPKPPMAEPVKPFEPMDLGDVPGSPPVAPNPAPARAGRVARPDADVVDWWSGRYTVKGAMGAPAPVRKAHSAKPRRTKSTPVELRVSAKEQRKNARARVNEMRGRAKQRRTGRPRHDRRYSNGPHPLVGLLILGVLGAIIFGLLIPAVSTNKNTTVVAAAQSEAHALAVSSDEPIAELPKVDARILLDREPIVGFSVPTEELYTRLRDHGVSITDGIDEDEGIGILADYRRTIGAVPSDSSSYIETAREWIGSHGDYDGVLVQRTEPRSGQTSITLITAQTKLQVEVSGKTSLELLSHLARNGYAAP